MPPRKVQPCAERPKGFALSAKALVLPVEIPDRDVGVAAVAGQALEGLRHEGRAQAVLLGDRLDHELEERMLVGGDERVVELPVHLELAVGVLVVVLVGLPAELQHGSRRSR